MLPNLLHGTVNRVDLLYFGDIALLKFAKCLTHMETVNRLKICLAALLSLSPLLNVLAADGLSDADSLYRAGRYDAAISLLEKEIVPGFEAQKDTISLMKAWSILGCCHVEKGDHEAAARYCRLTINAANYYGEDFFYVTNTLYNLAQMYHRLGSYDEALQYIDRSIIYELALGRRNIITRRYIEKATILMDMGEYNSAIDVLDVAYPNADALKNPHFRSQILYLKGLCYEAVGDAEAAGDVFSKSQISAHFEEYESDYVLVPGLTLKIGDYAMADADTTTAMEFYKYAIKNARNVREYETEITALKALAAICEDDDPDQSAHLMARADSLTFAPYVRELALKMALVGIEFPRRAREQQLKIQHMRFIMLALATALLAILALLLFYKEHASRNKAEYERERAETLERELDQKQRLLELAEKSYDVAFGEKVKQIAGELGKNGGLTKREREICAMIKQGLLNKEIAARLNLSSRTVENYRNAIYRKLNVNNTAGLMKVLEEVLDKE